MKTKYEIANTKFNKETKTRDIVGWTGVTVGAPAKYGWLHYEIRHVNEGNEIGYARPGEWRVREAK